MRTYKAYRKLLASPRWQQLQLAAARPQKLLWASTGTKDPEAAETLYIDVLAVPHTINTISEKALLALEKQGEIKSALRPDSVYAEQLFEEFSRAGVDVDMLAADLQREGAAAFEKSWDALMSLIASKIDTFKLTGQS
jgi:transaldolase